MHVRFGFGNEDLVQTYSDFLTINILFCYSGTFGQVVLCPSLPNRAIKNRENCRSLGR